MAVMEHILQFIIKWGIFFFETTGVIILVFFGIKAVVELVRRQEDARLNLAQGIALALQFKIGGEVLRTAIASTWEDLGIIGATILLRAALTFLIHWEIKHMEKRAKEQKNSRQAEFSESSEDSELILS